MPYRKLVTSAAMAVGLLSGLQIAPAAFSTLKDTLNEHVVFSDDFDDAGNPNGWSSIGSGATIDATNSLWYPSVAGSGVVTSTITLPNAIKLNAAQHQVDVYMRVKVINKSTDYFKISLSDTSGFAYGGALQESVGTSTISATMTSRNPTSGTGGVTTQTNTGNLGFTTTNFVDYRLQFDFVPAGGTYSFDTVNLTASHWNGTSYITDIAATPAKLVGGTPVTDGELKYLLIYDRNATASPDNRAYFDSVQVAVVPEPTSVAGLLGAGLSGLILQRRRPTA